jgi:hypothetical protein
MLDVLLVYHCRVLLDTILPCLQQKTFEISGNVALGLISNCLEIDLLIYLQIIRQNLENFLSLFLLGQTDVQMRLELS